tara:strand:+ start:36713 stop:38134 length:1422 start_codon:yes stop_codon:yes gene_type:complete
MAQNLFSRRRQTKRKQKGKRHNNEFFDDQANPSALRTLEVEKLSHEGRGIAKHKGKTQFIEGALITETVTASLLNSHNTYDELQVVEILSPSVDRIAPFCEYFEVCGGCSLQNMLPDAQLLHKETVLKEQYAHFGQVEVQHWLEPIKSASKAYRSKARLGVYFDSSVNKTVIGFREKQTKRLVDIQACPILDESIARLVPHLHELVDTLAESKAITHIELANSDDQQAVVIRHIKAISKPGIQRLQAFAEKYSVRIYLQAEAGQQAEPLDNNASELGYSISALDAQGNKLKTLTLAFHPQDFTQVNDSVNQMLINRALEQLKLKQSDKVLDLFCGLGNFTLPIALNCKQVVGIEGSTAMVSRATENAKRNQLSNAQFYSADLHADFRDTIWAKQTFDKILIDPPRAGALVVSNYLQHFNAERIVYISCNPATLARDAGVLSTHGYRLEASGVIDMFPNTAHIESIAVFVRQKK